MGDIKPRRGPRAKSGGRGSRLDACEPADWRHPSPWAPAEPQGLGCPSGLWGLVPLLGETLCPSLRPVCKLLLLCQASASTASRISRPTRTELTMSAWGCGLEAGRVTARGTEPSQHQRQEPVPHQEPSPDPAGTSPAHSQVPYCLGAASGGGGLVGVRKG